MLHNNLDSFERGESMIGPGFREKLNRNFEGCITGARANSDNITVDTKNGILLIGIENTGGGSEGADTDTKVSPTEGDIAYALDNVLAGDSMQWGGTAQTGGWIGTSIGTYPDTPEIRYLSIDHLGPSTVGTIGTVAVHPLISVGTTGTSIVFVYNVMVFDEKGHYYSSLTSTAALHLPTVVCGTA